MSKYINIEEATIAWHDEDIAEYGNDFEGGVMYALDRLGADDEDIELEIAWENVMRMRKKQLREEFKKLYLAAAVMAEKLAVYEKREGANAVSAATAVTRGELLEKVAGLFRPASEGEVAFGDVVISESYLSHGLAKPWLFTHKQAQEFIDLVEEMHERNSDEWKKMREVRDEND